MIESTILFIAAVISVVWAYVVVARLNEIATNTKLASESMQRASQLLFALRHPEIPWPKPKPDMIVWEERRSDGLDYRLRADGQWEIYRRRRWVTAGDS